MIEISLLLLSHFSRVRLCATPETAAHQGPPPWDSSNKNTGVGCHFLLQCMKVKSESEVAQSCPTLSDPMYRSLLGSSVHGIFQAVILEPPKIKSGTVSTVSPAISHEVMGPDAMIFVFLMLSLKPTFFTVLFHFHQEAFQFLFTFGH